LGRHRDEAIGRKAFSEGKKISGDTVGGRRGRGTPTPEKERQERKGTKG